MRMRLKMPRLAVSMEEGTIAEWLVADGARVEAGQGLYVIESEKAATEIPSPAAGTFKHIAAKGSAYKVGDVIAELETGG